MADNKFPTLPAKSPNWNKIQFHEVENKQWLILQHNMTTVGKTVGFIEAGNKSFTISTKSAGGFVEGGQHWLLMLMSDAEVGENGKFFQLKLLKKTAEGWKPDTEGLAPLKEKWDNNHLVAYHCTGIPYLEAVCEVLSERKLMVRIPVMDVYPESAMTKVQVKEMFQKYIAIELKEYKEDISEEEEEEFYEELSITGLNTPILQTNRDRGKFFIPYAGELPKVEKWLFTLPDISNTGGGGRSGTVVNAFMPLSERLAFITAPKTRDDCLAIIEMYGLDRDPYMLLNIALAISGATTIPFEKPQAAYTTVEITKPTSAIAPDVVRESEPPVFTYVSDIYPKVSAAEKRKYKSVLDNIQGYFDKTSDPFIYYDAWLLINTKYIYRIQSGAVVVAENTPDEVKQECFEVFVIFNNILCSGLKDSLKEEELKAMLIKLFDGAEELHNLNKDQLKHLESICDKAASEAEAGEDVKF